MKLFIDSSGEKLILSLINSENTIIDYYEYETSRDTTKVIFNSLNIFLTNNNLNLSEIKEYYFTIGPGSYTGTRIAVTMIKSIYLVYPNIHIFTISCFSLLKTKGKNYVYIKKGKSKYFYKKFGFFKFTFFKKKPKVIKEIPTKKMEKAIIGYDNFGKENLEFLIKNNYFKRVKNINKVKLIYD